MKALVTLPKNQMFDTFFSKENIELAESLGEIVWNDSDAPMSVEEIKLVSQYVNKKIREIGREMLDGCISVNPYEKGTSQACTYCSYKNVCGFDGAIPGYEKRKLQEYSAGEIFQMMKE